jgi:hypothetical protein
VLPTGNVHQIEAETRTIVLTPTVESCLRWLSRACIEGTTNVRLRPLLFAL